MSVCEHGSLKRKCEICELNAEITRLRTALQIAAKRMTKEKCVGSCRCAFCVDTKRVVKETTR